MCTNGWVCTSTWLHITQVQIYSKQHTVYNIVTVCAGTSGTWNQLQASKSTTKYFMAEMDSDFDNLFLKLNILSGY